MRLPIALSPIAAAVLMLAATRTLVQAQAVTAPAGSYTAEQARAGEATYRTTCATCHGDELLGGAGPALAGPDFLTQWARSDRNADDLFFLLRTTMPPGGAGSPREAGRHHCGVPAGGSSFFRPDANTIDVADLTRGPALAAQRVLLKAPAGTGFERNANDNMLDISRDGRRFLVSTSKGGDRSGDLVIVENFITELRAALAAGRAETR